MAADPFESIRASAARRHRIVDAFERPALATLIERDPGNDRESYFAGEVELHRQYAKRGVPWRGGVHTWPRLEYKAGGRDNRRRRRRATELERRERGQLGLIDGDGRTRTKSAPASSSSLVGRTLTMAVWPWSYTWDHTTPLRNYSKKNRRDRIAGGRFESREVLMRYVEGLLDDPRAEVDLDHIPWDFWEKRDPIVTAGLPDLVLPQALTNSRGEVENPVPGSAFCLGVCDDFETSVASLRKAQRLIDLEIELASDQGANRLVTNAATGRADAAVRPAVIGSLSEDVNRAIRCALAGPPDLRNWQGRPVVDLVLKILLVLVSNADRNAREREQRILNKAITAAAASPSLGAAREFANELCTGHSDRSWQQVRTWIDSDQAPQHAGRHWPLAQLLGVVVDALREQHASDNQEDRASAGEALHLMQDELNRLDRADLEPIRASIVNEVPH